MKERNFDEVLGFWLGTPATTAEQLTQKFGRWYQGGAQLDLEIDTRFGDVTDQVLRGGLQDWEVSARGRLALVIVLDQFARNVYRSTPRAYAGDGRALALALGMLERGDANQLNLEEQLFMIMPLIHAEDLKMHDRAVQLAEQMVLDEPTPELSAVWAYGAARTRHYGDIIRRFGRFPHRNAILGRDSTADELAFLREEAEQAERKS